MQAVKNKYRIVTDNYAGFAAQVRYWYFPFAWFQLDHKGRGAGANTSATIEGARAVVQRHKDGGPKPFVANVIERID